MTVSEGWLRRNRPVQLRASVGKILVAIVLIAFLVLHVIGGRILQRSSTQNDAFDVVLNRAID
jgi:hypothetical protein